MEMVDTIVRSRFFGAVVSTESLRSYRIDREPSDAAVVPGSTQETPDEAKDQYRALAEIRRWLA